MIRALIIVLFGVLVVNAQTFCSSYCTYTFSGAGYAADCTGSTNSTCTGCDRHYFTLSGTSCNVNTPFYNLEAVDLAPSGVLDGTWSLVNATNIVVSTYNTSYTIVQFTQMAAMTKTFPIANPHSSITLRMFVMLVGNPQFTMQLILNGDATNPITVDQSPRLYLSSTTSDSYIYTSPEIPNSAGALTLTISVSSYVSGSFGIKELMLLSKACPTYCSGCDSTGACTGCLLVGTTQYYLSAGSCLLYCQPGWYLDQTFLATFPDKCSTCNPSCLTCDSQPTNCTSCSLTNPYYKYLYNNTCISYCPGGSYSLPGSWVCRPCFKGCSSCYDTGKDSCNTCGYDSQLNIYYLVAGTTSCELSCPQGQFIDTTLFSTCSLCNLTCTACTINSTHCLSCTTNGTYQAFLYQFNNTCLQACPVNYTNDKTTHTCICPTTHYVNASTQACALCHFACVSCFGPSMDNCTQCGSYYYLLVNTSRCRTACPSTQFADDIDRICRKCDASCYTCAGSSSFCTGCTNSTYLNGSMCLANCPDGYQKQTSPNKCKVCPQLTYSYNGSCLAVCPAGYGPVGVVCVSNSIRNRRTATFSLDVAIVNTGTRLSLVFKFSAPLAPETNLSYANIQVTVVNSPNHSRLLQTVERLVLKNVYMSDDNTSLTLLTPIPSSIDDYEHSSLIVSFSQQNLFSSDGLLYETYSSTLALNSPLFVGQLFTNYYKSGLDGVGIFLTVGALVLVVAAYWNKKCQYLILEFLVLIQTVQLFNFIKYPMDISLAAFLRGFDASQFQFLPNAFSLMSTGYKENAFDGFQYKSVDMNFLRLAGSMLEALLIFAMLVGYLYLYDKQAFKSPIKWITKFVAYFCSTRLLFASTSSFIALWINLNNTDSKFLISQLLGLLCGGMVVSYFYYHNRKKLRKQAIFMLSSAVNCVLYPLFGLSRSAVLVVIVLLQSLLVLYFNRKTREKEKRHWCMLLLKASSITMVSLIVIVNSSTALIYLISTILTLDLVAVIYVYYATMRKQLKSKQCSSPTPEAPHNRVLPTNNTLITEIDEKQLRSLPNQTILQQEIEDSPVRHRVVGPQKQFHSKLEPAQQSDMGDIIHAQTERANLDSLTLFGGGKTVYQPTPKRRVRFDRQAFQDHLADSSEV